MRKPIDPWHYFRIAYLAILLILMVTKHWFWFTGVIFAGVLFIFVYAWYVMSYSPRKRLIDQAEAHKPDEKPSLGSDEVDVESIREKHRRQHPEWFDKD